MFHERDDGLRRALRVERVAAVEVATVGDALERAKRVWRFRTRELDFDAGLVARAVFQFLRGAEGDDFAVVDDGDAITEALGFLDVVRGHDDGFFLAAKLVDDVVDFAADLGVEAGGGLVEEKNARIVDESHGQREALLLAAGEFAVESVAFFDEAETFEEFFGIAAAGIEAGEKFDGFESFQFVGQRSGLESGADFVFEFYGVAMGIETADADAAAVEIAETFEDFDGGGFSGAVGAEEAEDFAFVDAEADATDGFEIAVTLDEIFDLDDLFGHRFA